MNKGPPSSGRSEQTDTGSLVLFRRLTLVALIATFVLITIGGLVRATESGLGCGTDWPDCSGELVPGLESNEQRIEFSHRAAASVVALVLGALMLVALTRVREQRRLVKLAVAAFILVLGQALLGMVVVKLELHAVSVVLHLGTALALLALLVHTVVVGRNHMEAPSDGTDRGIGNAAAVAAAAVFGLLLLGSYLSGVGAEREAGFPDWPLIGGRIVPDLGNEVLALHWLHRVAALLVGGVVTLVAVRVIRRREELPVAARLAHAALGLFALEVAIGAANVWSQGKPVLGPGFVTLHLATGAAIWALLVAIVSVTRTAPERSAEVPATRTPRPALESLR